jgi:hypothetical protein
MYTTLYNVAASGQAVQALRKGGPLVDELFGGQRAWGRSSGSPDVAAWGSIGGVPPEVSYMWGWSSSGRLSEAVTEESTTTGVKSI